TGILRYVCSFMRSQGPTDRFPADHPPAYCIVSQRTHARAPGMAEASRDFDQAPQGQQWVVSGNSRQLAKLRSLGEQIGCALMRLQLRFSHEEIERLMRYIGNHCSVHGSDSRCVALLRPACT